MSRKDKRRRQAAIEARNQAASGQKTDRDQTTASGQPMDDGQSLPWRELVARARQKGLFRVGMTRAAIERALS